MSGFWRGFRRWRRSRPFWGGLFLLLAGAELFFSANMDLGSIQIHVGPEGFLSYLLPLILVACGLLVWFTPAQRLFYAIVAAITAVYSLVGLNLGGFFIGMLLGMVGSALAFGWQPRTQPGAVAPVEQPEPEPEPEEDGPNPVYDAVFGDNYGSPRHASPEEAETEQLNYGQVPPGHEPGQRRGGGPGNGATYVVLLLALTLAAGAVAVFHAPAPAVAAPCPTTKPAPPKATEPPRAGATPTPSPTGEAAGQSEGDGGGIIGDIIGGIADGIGKLFGGGEQAAEPDATPTPTPTATGKATGKPAPPAPGKCGGSTTAPTKPTKPGKVTKNTVIPPPADQPLVQAQPSKLTGSKVVMDNLQYDGLVDLPTYNGTIRVMQFSMDKSVTDDFKLLTLASADKITQLTSSQLTVDGDVTFFCTKFSGNLIGVAPITFTVETPPPAILVPIIDFLPQMTFTKPDIDLVFVDTNRLKADDLVVKPI